MIARDLLPRRNPGILLLLALVYLSNVAGAKEPAYARFAKGEWKPAFTSPQAIKGGSNAEFKNGVVTLNDGFVRDSSDGALAAKDMIVRAKIRGRGALFLRGAAENYIAWFGEGAVGVNKYVDAKVHVLATRSMELDSAAFQELALAAVGDRVLVFVNGRRLLDVVDGAAKNASPTALQSYQTRSEFKDVEVMSLDGLDADKLLPERDPLAKSVGTWDVERTLTVAGRPPQKSTGLMHVARSLLGEFYVVRGTDSDGGSSLFMQQFLPEEPAIRTWIFLSTGERDQYDKSLDMDTGVQTIPPHPVENGILSGEIRPLDATTSETRCKTVGPDGKTISEFVSINKRRAEAAEPPDLRAGGPAKESPELATLAPYVGHWIMEAQMRPTKFDPLQRFETMQDDTEWVLGGRFLMRIERKPSRELVNLHLAGYDPAAKAFAFTAFQATGNVAHWNTTWDAETKTFHSKLSGLPAGWSGAGRDEMVDQDTLASVGLLKDGQGAPLWDATVTRRRKK